MSFTTGVHAIIRKVLINFVSFRDEYLRRRPVDQKTIRQNS